MRSEETPTEKRCCDCRHFGGGNWLDEGESWLCEKKNEYLSNFNYETGSYDANPAINCEHYEDGWVPMSKGFSAKVISARRVTIPSHVYEKMGLEEGDSLDVKITKWNEKVSYDIKIDKFATDVEKDGIIKNLQVKLHDQPGAGNKITFTLMKNGEPTALMVAIENEETSGADRTHEVAVTDEDVISLQLGGVGGVSRRR